MAAPADSSQDNVIPLPTFDHDGYVDRGFYVVVEFQDEKRRRDRTAAVKAARAHHSYVCLMTPDNRLLHRCVFTRADLMALRELSTMIHTWTSPRYFIMGYPIMAADLLRGLECYEKMGQTCSPLINEESAPFPAYFGCPRASVSLKVLHPRSWYALFYRDGHQDGHYAKCEWPEVVSPPPQLETPDAQEASPVDPVEELARVSRDYCGCPLVHLRRTKAAFDKLPAKIDVAETDWRMAPDLTDTRTLQPASTARYYDLLSKLGIERMASSDRPGAADIETVADQDTPLDPAQERRERLKRFTWLED